MSEVRTLLRTRRAAVYGVSGTDVCGTNNYDSVVAECLSESGHWRAAVDTTRRHNDLSTEWSRQCLTQK